MVVATNHHRKEVNMLRLALALALSAGPLTMNVQCGVPAARTVVTGRIIDADAQPVEGADIQLRSAANADAVVVRSDARGAYRAVVAGDAPVIAMRIRRLGLLTTKIQLMRRATDDYVQADVQLMPVTATVVASVR
jgi:hypothetical protein